MTRPTAACSGPRKASAHHPGNGRALSAAASSAEALTQSTLRPSLLLALLLEDLHHPVVCRLGSSADAGALLGDATHHVGHDIGLQHGVSPGAGGAGKCSPVVVCPGIGAVVCA
jgi:hypothetical protein